MSDRLRAIRDGLNKGDDVLVVRQAGAKPRKARVENVLSGAVRVRYEDNPGLVHTVMFRNITRYEEVEVKKPEPPPPPPPPPAPKLTAVPKPKPVAAPDDVKAWLDMGADISAKMEAEVADILQQGQMIDDDIAMLQAEQQSLNGRYLELQKRIAAVKAVLGEKKTNAS